MTFIRCPRQILLFVSFYAVIHSNYADSTCSKCGKNVNVAWWDLPPYMFQDDKGVVDGVFIDALERFVRRCCGDCIQFTYMIPPQNNSEGLQHAMRDNKTDVFVPIYGEKQAREYRGLPFYPVFESPGFIFVTGLPDHSDIAIAVMKTAVSAWPILVLLIMMAFVSGMIMWALDSYWNPDEFPPSFFNGAWEGFWWAFVSMTTVGYGDKAPRSLIARVFALMWVLVGLVIISLFTASVTTSLTALSFSSDTKMNGKSIVALSHTEEHRFGTKKNANVKTVTSFEEFFRLVRSKTDNDGGLIDAYTAGSYEKSLSEQNGIRFGSFIEHQISYGFVVSNALNKGNIPKCLFRQVNIHDFWITEMIRKKMVGLPEPTQSSAEEASSNLFNHRSDIYRSAVYWCVGIIVVLIIGGTVWEYMFTRPRYREKNSNITVKVSSDENVDTYERLILRQCGELECEMVTEVKNFLDAFHKNLADARSRQLYDKSKAKEEVDLKKFHNDVLCAE